MIQLLDVSLESFLRSEVPLPERDVDIAFEAPDSDWSSRINKPTVNLFLWDVRRNTNERESGMQTVEENGQRVRRQPPPRVDCRYLVTAWTTEVQDEHSLLGAVLGAFLQNDFLPEEILEGAMAAVKPLPTLRVASADGKNQSDFWSALGGQLKPGLDLMVTATLDAAVVAEAGPPVFLYQLDVEDKDVDGTSSSRSLAAGSTDAEPGTIVRSIRGTSAVDGNGRFSLPAEPGDEVVLESDKPVSTEVPEEGAVEFSKKKTKKK